MSNSYMEELLGRPERVSNQSRSRGSEIEGYLTIDLLEDVSASTTRSGRSMSECR